jgi:hypothetical protein
VRDDARLSVLVLIECGFVFPDLSLRVSVSSDHTSTAIYFGLNFLVCFF